MNIEKFLPYGSMVSLKGGTRKILIIGICLKSLNDDKVYDYCGCAHPYGFLNSDNVFLFNHDQIDKVYFKGYIDEELNDYYDDMLWKQKKESEQNNE